MRHDETVPASVDLRVTLAAGRKRDALELANPVMAASGTFGVDGGASRFGDGRRLGAWVTPGVTRAAHRGRGPRLADAVGGVLCATPYPSVAARWLLRRIAAPRADQTPVIVNLPVLDLDEAAGLALRFEDEGNVAAVELDLLACGEPAAAARAVRLVVDRCSLPLIAKLSPAGGDVVAGARAVVEAGADAVCVAGTFPALAVDVYGRHARLGSEAVLAGPAVKPLTLRLLYDVVGAVSAPVIASGGVATWRDAVEFLLAGATAVQVGTASFADPGVGFDIVDGLAAFMRETGESDVTALSGAGRATPMARNRPRRGTVL
jgi:dihydroorotate dehydrogenase (NAD+) catalytic subunit